MSRQERQRHAAQCESLEQRNMLTGDLLPITDNLIEDVRSLDGTGNNLLNSLWGSTDTQLLRAAQNDYQDNLSEPAGEDRPSAREISNEVFAQSESTLNDRYLTDFVWQWGQFLDHDIDLTEGSDPPEAFDIDVPTGDPYFDPTGSGTATISLGRSIYDDSTGTSDLNPREQINEITAFIDGSNVYGSDEQRADALRTFEGGKLKTSSGDLLPFNEEGLENAGGTSDSLFIAGDIRANEQVGLTAMHTLFVREHNWWADQIAEENPGLTDEEIYQQARSIVIAEMQAITYNEFLPALLGEDALGPYFGYDDTIDPSIANEFSTAAYRFGHSMLSSEILRLNEDGTTADEGNLSLRNMFFSPDEIIDNGIDSLLLGLASQKAQEIDSQVVDDIRNFLFGAPGSGGFDLASLNIQRGRDHGLADFNTVREAYGLEPATSFDQITSDPELVATLEDLYGTVDNIDLWVCGLAEDHVEGSSMGETFSTILVDQFERLRSGDRFWYENVFAGRELNEINETTLSEIIVRNTEITTLQENVFVDEGFWTHEVEGRGTQVTFVSSNDDQVVIREGRQGSAQDLSALEEVSLVGRENASDVFVIDSGMLEKFSGNLRVTGQAGRSDVLILVAQPSDEVNVSDGLVLWNGNAIQIEGIERIIVFGQQRHVAVEVDDATDIDVDVVRPPRMLSERDVLQSIESDRDRDDRRDDRRSRDRGRDFASAVDQIYARRGR